jgi:phosphatidylinositol alpha-1,6-mannosyltransferase
VDHTKFHPVDKPTRQATRAKFGFTDDDIVLSHHGILHPNKGNDWIFQCLEKLKSELPGLNYLLIGNGPEMDSLKQLAKKTGIEDRVVFAGWLPSEKTLNDALASADIGLVMRIGQETDHFHMTDTLAHEMACGKPILAVNLKGIAEVIHDGENGFLFSPDHSEEFRTKAIRLAGDPQLQRLFGCNVLELSRSISTTNHCSELVATALEHLSL